MTNAFLDLTTSDGRIPRYVQHPVTAVWQLAVYDGNTRRQRVALDDLPDGSYAAFTVRDGLAGTPYTVTLAAPLVIGSGPPATISPYVQDYAAAVVTNGGSIPQAEQLRLTALETALKTRNPNRDYWTITKALNLLQEGTEASQVDFVNYNRALAIGYSNPASTALGLDTNGTGLVDSAFYPTGEAVADNLAISVYENYRNRTPGSFQWSFGLVGYTGGRELGVYHDIAESQHTKSVFYFGTDRSVDASNLKVFLNAESSYTLQSNANGLLEAYQFGRPAGKLTRTNNGLPSHNFSVYFGARSDFGSIAGNSETTIKHYVIREALTDAENEEYYQILQEYEVARGRAKKAHVFGGDSLTQALFNAPETDVVSWARRYCDLTNHDMQNWAVSSEVGQTFLDSGKADAVIPTYNALIHGKLFLAHGTNDIIAGLSASQYAGVLDALITLAIGKGWPAGSIVVLPTFYQIFDNNGAARQTYYAAAQTVCANRGVQIVPVYADMKAAPNADSLYFYPQTGPNPDGLHYVQAGHDFLAQRVFATVG